MARLTADFVERSEADEARDAARRKLEAELRESQRQQRALLEADRRKDAFLATLSHELRGPLSPIANALEVLNRHPEDPAISSWARQLMQRQISQLSHLIDDLLDLNRITQDKIKLRRQPVALRAIIDQAVEACRPLLDAREHNLLLAFPSETICVQADAVRLTQVFVNLVHNACKFTAPRGDIHVTAKLEGTEVAIRVRDWESASIPARSIPFSRCSARSRHRPVRGTADSASGYTSSSAWSGCTLAR